MAAPMGFALVLAGFNVFLAGQIHVFPLLTWTVINIIVW